VQTPSTEDYLKAIYMLSERGGSVSTGDVAARLSITPASVTGMMKRLASADLVLYESHRGVSLTEQGRKIALEVIRYSLSSIHAEAENLEHHISEEFEERIATLLGNPSFDPHGHPIPDKDGTLPAMEPYQTLLHAAPGTTVRIARLDDADSATLVFFEEHRILPGNDITIHNVQEDGLYIQTVIGDVVLPKTMAECISVFL
jgi:DtxR family Mn-dependent transcriptional regulator